MSILVPILPDRQEAPCRREPRRDKLARSLPCRLVRSGLFSD